jgi:hypothetical protein
VCRRCQQGLDAGKISSPGGSGEVFFLDIPFYRTRPGRNKWIWKIAKGVEMRFEQHPYFGPGAAACETEPHWQIKVGKRNIGKWMPGDPIPGIF